MPAPFTSRPEFSSYSEEWFTFGRGSDLSNEAIEQLSKEFRDYSIDNVSGGDIWSNYDHQSLAERRALCSGNVHAVREVVKCMFGGPLTAGFGQGPVAHNALKTESNARHHTGTIALDRLLRLAEAVGAINVLSAEHGQTTISSDDREGVLSRIEAALGVDLPAPTQDGGLYGLHLRGRIYSERHFDGMYAAWRIREIARAHRVRRPSVCEIGGGAGYVAYYARKLGCRSFSIIDLPQAQIVQYILLSSAYGACNVTFGRQMEDGFGLISAKNENNIDLNSWDIIINIDSIPEMPRDVALRYLLNIQQNQLFLSINQESGASNGTKSQNIVSELAANAGLKRLARHPSWLRTGYVEEVYVRP